MCVCVHARGGSNGLTSLGGSMAVKSSPDKTIRHRKHSGCYRSGGLIPDERTFHIRQGNIIRPFMSTLLISTSDEDKTNLKSCSCLLVLLYANTLLTETANS